ncbi:hypothetical protein [uncultured Pontibacter sp.]|uniref:hypothetical protein n=1 Tax=uncultured Pontibacter sp. TaxID=453356 RepID=UPI00262D8496|nr:hypothetical protein [uncultured Pontibacter sp.]
MKIVVLLFAVILGLGFAAKEALRVQISEHKIAAAQPAEEVEASVMQVLLDTVEIAVSSQNVIAGF